MADKSEYRRVPAMGSTPRDMPRGEAFVCDYLERARMLGPELDGAAEEIERRGKLPDSIVAALVERGLFRLLLPRALGGADLPPGIYVQVIEEVAKHDASTAWCLSQAHFETVGQVLLGLPPEGVMFTF
jgi:alkylation response protein AidB-like acyl-CoA dehydrogenase